MKIRLFLVLRGKKEQKLKEKRKTGGFCNRQKIRSTFTLVVTFFVDESFTTIF
jgi:hypothetical protein